MAILLSIETSTRSCSVALQEDDQLLACHQLRIAQSHSVRLTQLCQAVCHSAGKTLKQVDALVVAKGPGSYTGLRIGTSTAKGLCYALDCPLIAINSLKALAHSVKEYIPSSARLCPMLDARRMEVYCAVYDQALGEISATEAKIIESNSFADLLADHPVYFFGDGSDKCRALLAHQENAHFLGGIYPDAASIGTLGYAAYLEEKFEDLAYFEPFYLKDFVAKVSKKYNT